jgi:KDO2-lipid IV(A) lauroyltransferase
MIIKMLRLTPRRPAIAFMRLVGRTTFLLAGAARSRAIKHLSMAFGTEMDKQEIEALARKVFIHFATVTCDMLRMPNLVRAGVNQLVTAEGKEHLDRALEAGRGVILVTCHFGNWELLGAWLAQNGYPMKVVGTTLYDPRFDRILIETRNNAGYTNIARGTGTREILRALRNNEAVGMLIDQDTTATSVFVNFFGRLAHTPTGPAVLARRLNVPIIPIFMYMKNDLNYHLKCQPPLELVKTDDEDSDITANTQKISDTYEAMIRRYPWQWGWMHKRWRTQPDPNNE